MYWLEDERQANVGHETGARAEDAIPKEDAAPPVVAKCEGYKLTEGVDMFRAKCDLTESRCEPVCTLYTTFHAALPADNRSKRRDSAE